MSQRRSAPSSDEFRDDLDYDQLSFDNELARQLARVWRTREGGQQRGLSELLAEHEAPIPVRVVRSPNQFPIATPSAVRDALRRAMEMSGVPTVPAGVGVAPNVSSPSSGVPSVSTIQAAAQNLPSPTWRKNRRKLEVILFIVEENTPRL